MTARLLFAAIALAALGEAFRASSAGAVFGWLAVFGVALRAAIGGGQC